MEIISRDGSDENQKTWSAPFIKSQRWHRTSRVSSEDQGACRSRCSRHPYLHQGLSSTQQHQWPCTVPSLRKRASLPELDACALIPHTALMRAAQQSAWRMKKASSGVPVTSTYVPPEFLIRSRPCSNYTAVLRAFFNLLKISQLMCTLMDWPIFACASWAAADSSYLTNDFFRHKDLRPDCVPTTPTRRATTSCLERSVRQMALFRYAVASCGGLKAQRDAWPSNLHPSYMSQPGVKLIRPWSDVTGTEGMSGGTQKKNTIPHFPNYYCVYFNLIDIKHLNQIQGLGDWFQHWYDT